MAEQAKITAGAMPVVKKTAIVTAAVVIVVLQITVLRVFGDVLTSAALVGLGYVAGRMR